MQGVKGKRWVEVNLRAFFAHSVLITCRRRTDDARKLTSLADSISCFLLVIYNAGARSEIVVGTLKIHRVHRLINGIDYKNECHWSHTISQLPSTCLSSNFRSLILELLSQSLNWSTQVFPKSVMSGFFTSVLFVFFWHSIIISMIIKTKITAEDPPAIMNTNGKVSARNFKSKWSFFYYLYLIF